MILSATSIYSAVSLLLLTLSLIGSVVFALDSGLDSLYPTLA